MVTYTLAMRSLFVLILALPMLLSSLQTAIEAPGLPFGYDEVGKGWKKILLQNGNIYEKLLIHIIL